MSGPRYGSRYGTSTGALLFHRGNFNHTPRYNYLSGDGRSTVYEGSGYYVPRERIWQSYIDYRSLPPKSRRDAIHMESEDQWVAFMRQRDSVHQPGGISVAGYPDLFRRNPLPQLLPFRTKAWIRKWDSAGYFYPPADTWVHEQLGYEEIGPDVPCGAYHFHNEEDWVKLKYRFEKPKINFAKKDQYNVPLPPSRF